ncbi:MAG: CIA30 family protein [Planctomycetota bacterium]|jgi:monofunctional biosynthetic peptidoglycan transglycosylase
MSAGPFDAVCGAALAAVVVALMGGFAEAGPKRTISVPPQAEAPPVELMLFDFADPAVVESWRAVDDTVMGGLSRSRLEAAEGWAVFAGNVSLENFGGFATVRAAPAVGDLAGYDGLAVRVRGDGKRYTLFVKNNVPDDGRRHQASFDPGRGQWRTIRIPFSRFRPHWRGLKLFLARRLNIADVKAVGFMIADRQGGPFRLEIRWVKAYRDR